MRPTIVLACLLIVPAVTGCPVAPSPLAKAQETATALNVDARFGRLELAMEHVSPTLRDEFVAHHRSWGSHVRVADVEIAGVRPHGEHAVEVAVRVAWYLVDQDDLRLTTLEQGWSDQKGGWQLVAERRVEGDVGLFGEPIVYDTPEQPRQPAHFPTVRLGAAPDSESAEP
jgi:hypothetical protein